MEKRQKIKVQNIEYMYSAEKIKISKINNTGKKTHGTEM